MIQKTHIKSNLTIEDELKAQRIAEQYLLEIGMDEENFLISADSGKVSKTFMKLIEQQKVNLVKEQFQMVKSFLIENESIIRRIQQAMVQKEILEQKDILSILSESN